MENRFTSAFRLMATKEIVEHLRTYRFVILIGLLAVLVTVSFITSYGDYEIRMENYNVLRPAQTSSTIMLPPNPLSLFVRGLDANFGRLLEISATGIAIHSSQQSINRLFSLFTVPDMLFIIKVMLAVTALLFSFDAISGEKEQGMIKLLLANGCPRISLLAGKLVGRYALVFVPFAILFGCCAAVVSLLPDVQTGTAFWERLGGVLAAAAIYTLLFSSIGILVSTLVSRSATSMSIVLGIWVLFVFVIPNLGVIAARSLSDVPAGDRVEMEGRLSTIRSIFEAIQKGRNGGGTTDVELELTRQTRESNKTLFEQYQPKFNRLAQATMNAVRLSPSGVLTFLLTDLAGTGLREDARMKNAVMFYVDRNFDRILGREKAPAEDFRFQTESPADSLSGPAGVDALILVLCCAGCAALAGASFLRYDPR